MRKCYVKEKPQGAAEYAYSQDVYTFHGFFQLTAENGSSVVATVENKDGEVRTVPAWSIKFVK